MDGKKKLLNKKNILRAAIILLALVIVGVGAGVLAKYLTEKEAFSGRLHVTAKLFTKMEIWEHEIVEDGDSYTLNDKLVTGNAYKLHPGITVPKDPAVYITGKTGLKGYLYVEVVDGVTEGSRSAIQYALADHWLDTGLTGQNRGKVYVYAVNGTPVEVTNADGANFSVQILAGNTVGVSESWEPESAMSGLELTFYAYMVQVQEGVNYQQAFTAAFMTSGD